MVTFIVMMLAWYTKDDEQWAMIIASYTYWLYTMWQISWRTDEQGDRGSSISWYASWSCIHTCILDTCIIMDACILDNWIIDTYINTMDTYILETYVHHWLRRCVVAKLRDMSNVHPALPVYKKWPKIKKDPNSNDPNSKMTQIQKCFSLW